jgi:hypothetical protein
MGKSYHRAENAGVAEDRIPQLGVAFLTVVADAAVKVVEFSFLSSFFQ